tara:strand:+ start:385 stop:582 length:198 start_codon:yes stop_codon:yes gene_type:complete
VQNNTDQRTEAHRNATKRNETQRLWGCALGRFRSLFAFDAPAPLAQELVELALLLSFSGQEEHTE